MTDRELLEMAAKAAGIVLAWSSSPEQSPRNTAGWDVWNPLDDDGDALRLAVELRLEPVYYCRIQDDKEVVDCLGFLEVTEIDPYAATRRAIVRAAADIGKCRS